MEIKDDLIRNRWTEANELDIGECFEYNDHIYLKTTMVIPTSLEESVVYVDLTDNKTYPKYEFEKIFVEPVKAHVQIKYCKS